MAARKSNKETPGSKAAFGEVGRSGLKYFGGFVQEEFLPQLQGERARRIYREMRDNDPVVGALLFAIDMLMRQVEWRIEPPSEDPQDGEVAEFVQSCLYDMSQSWEDTLSSILSFLPFGFSWHEVVYKRRLGWQPESDEPDAPASSAHNDGLIGWRKLAIRAQETLYRWDIDDAGGIQGFIQLAPPTYEIIPIPIGRSLLFRTTSQKNNPEGRSVLRNAYRPWWFKKRLEEIEAIGVERSVAGLPVAWVPPEIMSPGASTEEKALYAELKKIIRNIRQDQSAGVIWPLEYTSAESPNKKYDLTLLSPASMGRAAAPNTDAIIARYDQRIAMTVLADFILLGHEAVGSKALGSSKIDLFAAACGAWLDEIGDVLNTHAIPRLMRINGFPPERSPRMAHDDVKQVDIELVGKYLLARAQAGEPVFPDPAKSAWLDAIAGLPASESEEVE